MLFSETINVRQSQLEKLYAGLKDLAEERRGKLDETHKLYQLIREVRLIKRILLQLLQNTALKYDHLKYV